MEQLLQFLRSVQINPEVFGKSIIILAIGSLLLSSISRFAFGQKSTFSRAVSSALVILFVYAVAVIVYSIFPDLIRFIPTLPYVTINPTTLVLFSFSGSHYTLICSQVLSMMILAFLANLLDHCIPSVKNPFLWLLLKCVTVLGAIGLQLLCDHLIRQYLPWDLLLYAPAILLGMLIVLLLVGALKLIVGALLSTVHPLIGAFYTFFFSTFIGKSITKALLTTGILTALVLGLRYIGCISIAIAAPALIAYIPFALLLLFIWYVTNRILS